MFKVKNLHIKADKYRIGYLTVKYYDLDILCDLCLYKDESLWIRLPQIWRDKQHKISFNFWCDKEKSDLFQKEVLQQVIQQTGVTVESAIAMIKEFHAKRKTMTNKK